MSPDTQNIPPKHATRATTPIAVGESSKAPPQYPQVVNLGVAYEFMWAANMPVTQDSSYRGNVAGSFDNAWFSFFTANLTWKF
jgi:hypothetical protein